MAEIPLRVKVERLQGELDWYRQAFTELLQTRLDLSASADARPTREELLIQVTTLREALRWCLVEGDYKLKEHRAHLDYLLANTLHVPVATVQKMRAEADAGAKPA